MTRLRIPALLFIFGLSLVLVVDGRAQMRSQAMLGLAGSGYHGEANSQFSTAFRFFGGIGVRWPVSGGLSVGPELLYTLKGAKAEGDIRFPEIEEDVRVKAWFHNTYIEVPLLLSYSLDGSSMWPRFFVGPYAAYLITSSITYQNATGGPKFTETDDSVEDWDYGLVLGAALHFLLGDEEFSLGARASFGLSDVTRPVEDAEVNQNLKTQFVGVYASIVF